MNRLTTGLGETSRERRDNEHYERGVETFRVAVIKLLESALDRDETLCKIIEAVEDLNP